jgi:iron complex outermembrane receptor protein
VQRGALPRAYPNDWFGLTEKDSAAYVQADLKGTGWAGNIGLRYVHTVEDITMYAPANAQTPGVVTTSLFGDFAAVPVSNSYNDVLPSANLKLDLAKDVVGRLAVAETMTRADYSALAGFTNLTPPANFPGTGSGSGSNPNLKPIRSVNYDAGLEWYFAPRSLLAGTLFYMDLRNYIGYGSQILSYTTYGSGLPPGGVVVPYNLTVPINTQGRAQGIEMTYTQALTEHFGAEANYTFTDAKQTSAVPPGGDDRLVGASKNVYNITGYFENAHFSTRVSWNYRSAYYSGLDRSTAFSQDSIGTLAASVSYLYNENLSVTLDGQNLNDPTLKYYALNTTQPRAFYVNGRQFYLSVRARF